MKKLLTTFCFTLLGLFTFASAQTSLSLPEITLTQIGESVSAPIEATDFNNVGAISIKIEYDDNALTFDGIPDPLAGNFSFSEFNGIITISWFSTTPMNLGNGTLLHLDFTHSSGNSNLSFISGPCEISDVNGYPINVTYYNGWIHEPSGNNFAMVGDFVWNDTNENGIQEQGEPGLQWVTVELYDCNDNWLDWCFTNENGFYSFDSLAPGDYKLKFYLIDGYSDYVFAPEDAGNDDEIDSDVDPSTGFTECFTLVENQTNFSFDAGAYESISSTGSIGDFVWSDNNGNGIQDNGEPGLEGVSVKLMDCSYNVLNSTTTDSDGFYEFNDLDAGDYIIKITLMSGYTFSPMDAGSDDNIDSDVNGDGKTECFTLAEGEMKDNVDAGMCEVETYPELWVEKDDYNVFMPDSGEHVIYTITYGNSGTATLMNASITDTLPMGVSYVACSGGPVCGESEPGSNIVVFDLGSLEPGDNGLVKVTGSVDSRQSEYLNVAWLMGQDSNGSYYCESDEDLNLCDTTSGGGGSGIESNADLASLLLQRQVKIYYGQTTKMLSNNNPIFPVDNSLSDLIPQVGPYNSYPVETTPFDILGISNAVESYAVDYMLPVNATERRVGSIFSTITNAPDIYNHTKAVCDRLAGYTIEDIQLMNINGYEFYGAKIRNGDRLLTDYAISFSVYETEAGYFIENKWTVDEYVAPAGATMVYNFQVWTGTYSETITLVEEIIDIFNAQGNVTYMMEDQYEPVTFVSNAKYNHNGTVILTIENTGNTKPVHFDIQYRVSQDGEQLTFSKDFNVQTGENEFTIETGIISDAKLYMSQPQGFLDEVFVSGGAYTYVIGEQSEVTSFNTAGYPQQDLSNYPAGSVVLSGGFEVSGELNDWITSIRSLKADFSPYNLTGYNGLRFDASGTGTIYIILILSNTSGYNYHAHKIILAENEQTYTLAFNQFEELYGDEVVFDPANIQAIGFMYTTDQNPGLSNINMEAKNIAFLNSVLEVNDGTNLPDKFELAQNYPNPFNPSTIIQFSVPKEEHLSLKVYDILGQEVRTLVNERMKPGIHKITFDASNLASGIYFYRLTGKSINVTKKMILTK